jgi:hypothetical protein
MAQQSAAAVIDLEEYRRRRQAQSSSTPQPQARLIWLPTTWGYWVPVWATR